MKPFSAKPFWTAAMSMALVCISTLFFKIPIPLGYAHLGNGFILAGCALTGGPYGILVGGVGSAMADLLGGYSQWILPTLLIKGLMGFTAGSLMLPKGKTFYLFSFRTFLGCGAGVIIMVAGYFLGGILLSGSLAAGIAQVPGLIGEGIIGILLFYVMGGAFEKIHLRKYIY